MSESFAIAVGRFYAELAERLVSGARAAFAEHGHDAVEVFDVPGAFELPLAAELRRQIGALRGRGLPGGGDPRRDRPLRLRLRRGGQRGDARAAARPGCRAPSACSPARRWSRRSRARAADKRDQGRHAAEAVIRMAALRTELASG